MKQVHRENHLRVSRERDGSLSFRIAVHILRDDLKSALDAYITDLRGNPDLRRTADAALKNQEKPMSQRQLQARCRTYLEDAEFEFTKSAAP